MLTCQGREFCLYNLCNDVDNCRTIGCKPSTLCLAVSVCVLRSGCLLVITFARAPFFVCRIICLLSFCLYSCHSASLSVSLPISFPLCQIEYHSIALYTFLYLLLSVSYLSFWLSVCLSDAARPCSGPSVCLFLTLSVLLIQNSVHLVT